MHQNLGDLTSGGERIELVGGANAAYPLEGYHRIVFEYDAMGNQLTETKYNTKGKVIREQRRKRKKKKD